MRDFSIGEVKTTFPALFFCKNSGILLYVLCSYKERKKGCEYWIAHQITFLCSNKDRVKVLSLLEHYPKNPDITPFF